MCHLPGGVVTKIQGAKRKLWSRKRWIFLWIQVDPKWIQVANSTGYWERQIERKNRDIYIYIYIYIYVLIYIIIYYIHIEYFVFFWKTFREHFHQGSLLQLLAAGPIPFAASASPPEEKSLRAQLSTVNVHSMEARRAMQPLWWAGLQISYFSR